MMAIQEVNEQVNEVIDESNIILKRDCNAILIPNGIPITMHSGEKVSIMQKLGGSFTIYYNGNLARVDGRDADALGFDIPKELAAAIKKIDKKVVGDGFVSEEAVWEQLRTCFDPEIPGRELLKPAVYLGAYKYLCHLAYCFGGRQRFPVAGEEFALGIFKFALID